MGVMACSRNNCENVMCDRHSHEHGYICYDCFNELVNRGPSYDVKDFMASVKHAEPDKSLNARVVFEAVFPFNSTNEGC